MNAYSMDRIALLNELAVKSERGINIFSPLIECPNNQLYYDLDTLEINAKGQFVYNVVRETGYINCRSHKFGWYPDNTTKSLSDCTVIYNASTRTIEVDFMPNLEHGDIYLIKVGTGTWVKNWNKDN